MPCTTSGPRCGSIPHIGLYLTLGWVGYLVWVGGWIVLQKREPVATLSWLLGLAALPYLGFLVYYVFGPQKIKRHRLRRGRSRVGLPASEEAEAGGEAMRTAAAGAGHHRPAREQRDHGAAAGRWRRDLRRPDRGDRPRAAPRPPRVLHLCRRPQRCRAARCAGRARARRRAGAPAAGRGRQRGNAARVLRAAARCRRRTGVVPSDALRPHLEAAMAEPALASQDRGGRQRGRRSPAASTSPMTRTTRLRPERLPRPAPAPGRRRGARAAAGLRRGLGLRDRHPRLHRRRRAHAAAAARRARSRRRC